MKKKSLIFIVSSFIAASIYLFNSFHSSNISDHSSLSYPRIKVIDVIDGDTIKLENQKLVRYIGVDTPESRLKKGDKFVYAPQPFARQATELNQNLVLNKFIRIEFDEQQVDQYGRLLGYCFVDDLFVNAKILEEGLAVLYARVPNVKYTNVFIQAQTNARNQKKGLWGSYEIVDASDAHQYVNQIRTVRGKVLSTYQSAKCIFLNFGSNYKTDFSIVIFNDAISSFYGKNIDPLTFYKGKDVEVSGRIKRYNGPEIIVGIPEQITIIQD